jgi:hypothetical protein
MERLGSWLHGDHLPAAFARASPSSPRGGKGPRIGRAESPGAAIPAQMPG